MTKVYWEDDPTKTREVTHFCLNCRASEHDFNIVSPQGTAHRAAEYEEDKTVCGKDATGKEWWWQT